MKANPPVCLFALALTLLLPVLTSCVTGNRTNHYAPYPAPVDPVTGVSWPQGQALPIFARPADTLDTILVQSLSRDEQITFSSLQGQVNRTQPRIYLLSSSADEGTYTWAETSTVNFTSRELYDRTNKYELVAKYADEVEGLVLYDPEINPHYRNLAGTVAGLKRALPVTAAVRQNLEDHGIELDVLVDLTELEYTETLDIYQYLYDNYWDQCDRRLLISAKPHDQNGGGDYHHTRDMAAATGVAVVWLNTLDDTERDMLRKFFADMTAGEAVVLGWYTTERSGVTTASEFGIGTIPADFYISGSVYSGTGRTIEIPPVPRKPELENRIYITVFISDGDNIQYTQRAMRRIWDEAAASRGRVPLNWTIAPGLVDVGPGLLNYYYTTATPNDYFVTGPSGMGYLMPFNTLTEPGAPVGDKLTDRERMEGYARLTETYLQRSGLRVVTVWDDATPMQRAAYERFGRNLYGVTVQNFRDVPSVRGSVENNRVRFDRLIIPYTGTYEHMRRSLTSQIDAWDGESPLFLSYQVDVWGEMKPNRIVDLYEDLRETYGDRFTFVRADHYFNLYNEANGLPFNLSMNPATSLTASASADSVENVIDGTPRTLWEASGTGRQWIEFDLGDTFSISRYVIRHAGEHGLPQRYNTRDFSLQVSTDDGASWTTVDTHKGNRLNVTDIEFDPTEARHVRLVIDNAGRDSVARIAEVELFGIRR